MLMPDDVGGGSVGGEGISSIGSDGSNSSMQSSMEESFFYDEGTDSVVDANGISQTDDDGNVIRNMDDFNSHNKKPVKGEINNADVNSQNQKGTAIDSLFNKDGSFDFDGAVNAATKLNDFNYQMRSSYKQAEPQKSVSQDPMAAKAQALASVKEYKNQLSESQIKPLERAYQNILQMYRSAGEEVPQGVYEALNAEYLNVEKVINDQVEKKRDELLLDLVSQSSSAAEMKALEDKSLSNFRAFADQTLPNVPNAEREKRLGELVFGYTGADGKYTRGYGADLIDALFDSAQGNKSFGSQQELRETYNNWWAKFSSDKKNMGLIINIAFSRYVAANHAKYRDEYRKSWERESFNKKRNSNSISRAGQIPPKQDDSADLLDQYHSVRKRNM